jgi:hypothetical protein
MVASGWTAAARGMEMRNKAIAAVLIAGLAVALAAVLRTTNRADAAAGNCYSETQGPASPTICN